jgi:hypothetical protein
MGLSGEAARTTAVHNTVAKINTNNMRLKAAGGVYNFMQFFYYGAINRAK